MSKTGPIIILEDDPEDQEILQDALNDLGILNKIIFFANGVTALDYLQSSTEQPFIIFSDVNLPMMNGLQLRAKIDEEPHLRKKCIPFVFFTTSSDRRAIDKAYELTVQGYFTKANSFQQVKESLRMIIQYWGICKHPNSL